MTVFEIKNELDKVFNKYKFTASDHHYDNVETGKRISISTTGLIEKYSQPFDAQINAERVAIKRGISVREVLDEWKQTNLYSTVKGSICHEYAQSLWNGINYQDELKRRLETMLEGNLRYSIINTNLVSDNFYKNYKDKYEYIADEQIVGSDEYDICGSVDLLLKNKATGGIALIDFKTNKEIKYKGFRGAKMKVPLNDLEDCNYCHYELQLSIYKYLIEKYTSLKIEEYFIVYLNENAIEEEIIKIDYLENEVKKILEMRNKKMNSVPVLLIGKSGSGKSASMRNFTKDEIAIVNVLGKPLPFKNDLNAPKCDDYKMILNAIEKTDKKTIVIDDANYLITNEFMAKASVKGYDKYSDMANNFWNLIQGIKNIQGGKTVYLIMHEDTDDLGNIKPKTIGKMLDEKVNIQGLFTVCIRTVYENNNYIFKLKTNGQDCVKTPIGMFETDEMENDLKLVDKTIKEYYDLDKKEEEK